MKRLIHSAALLLATMTFAPAAKADGGLFQTGVNHLNNAYPSTNNAHSLSPTYKFEVHVLRPSLSDLSIDLPYNISAGGVEVFDQTGRKLDTTTSIVDKKVAIAFSQPVTSGTILNVKLLNVSSRWRQGGVFLFPISSEGRPIEIARIHTYD